MTRLPYRGRDFRDRHRREETRNVFSLLEDQASRKNRVIAASFRNEILEYVRTLKATRARRIYPQLREITPADSDLIIAVIGYRAIEAATELGKPLDRSIVNFVLDKLKDPKRHIPDDPDDTCRKTAAIAILEKKEEFRNSLPFRIT